MKILRITVTLLFLLTSCVFAWVLIESRLAADPTIPIIEIPEGTLEVSIHGGDEQLLQGVTAHDDGDGDLTDRIIVEDISRFSEGNLCTVTYAVADSGRHVAKNTRKIHYYDYESPRFTLQQSPVFPVGKTLTVDTFIGAVDSLDGDISSRVIVDATDYQFNTVGVFTLSLQAANSKGDIIHLDLPIYIEEINARAGDRTEGFPDLCSKGRNPGLCLLRSGHKLRLLRR